MVAPDEHAWLRLLAVFTASQHVLLLPVADGHTAQVRVAVRCVHVSVQHAPCCPCAAAVAACVPAAAVGAAQRHSVGLRRSEGSAKQVFGSPKLSDTSGCGVPGMLYLVPRHRGAGAWLEQRARGWASGLPSSAMRLFVSSINSANHADRQY